MTLTTALSSNYFEKKIENKLFVEFVELFIEAS